MNAKSSILTAEGDALPELASPAQAFREVFISGTKVDLEEYRLAVREALETEGIGAFLFDYDAQPAIPVVDYCVGRIRDTSDAYLGVYGYRYGWIPTWGSNHKSITHLEYEAACERWVPRERHRIFLFQPEPGSPAAQELERFADQALAKDYPDDGSCPDWLTCRQASKDRQTELLRSMARPDVAVNRFNSCEDLKRRAPLAVRNGQGWIVHRAPSTRGRPIAVNQGAGFGKIGRDKQLETLNKVWRTLAGRPDCPAVSVVVHGESNMGHRWFADCLRRWEGWESARDHLKLSPPEDRTEIAWLRDVMAAGLAPGSAAPTSDFQTLASTIRERCCDGPAVVILDHVEKLQNALAGFHNNFWLPLHDALRQQWIGLSPPRYSFAMVTILRELLSEPTPPFVWSGEVTDPFLDYTLIVPLPKLGKLTKKHLRDYVRDDLHNWTIDDREIARLKGNGVPADVFGRLIAKDLIDLEGGN